MLNKERPEVKQALVDFFSDESEGTEKYEKFRENTNCQCLSYPNQIFNKSFKDWLNSEYIKPFQITKSEKCILENMKFKNIDSRHDILIQRTTDDYLYVEAKKSGELAYRLPMYEHLFPFIEPGDLLELSDILENCEVVKYEE